MNISRVKTSRRVFIKWATVTAAATAVNLCLPACRSGSAAGSIDAKDVLKDLERNEAIRKLKSGDIEDFKHKNHESLTDKGKKALSIIQRGLFALGLIRFDAYEFKFGVYGSKTTTAVRYLQNWAEIDPEIGRDGQRFEQSSLLALEAALEMKVNGLWKPPREI